MGFSDEIKVNKKGLVELPDGTEVYMTFEDYRYMKLLQDYVTEIMVVIDDFCRKNNITYYLGEGTLLGALRHKGFIPWDDDSDILMPREDYEKFLALAKDGLPEGYQLDSPETNKHNWTVISQVQITRKVPYVKDRLKNIALNNGPSVDIFPLDYVPNQNSAEVISKTRRIRTLRRTMWIKSGLHNIKTYRSFKRRITLYYPLKVYGWFRSFKSLHAEVTRLSTSFNKEECKYFAMFGSLYPIKREIHNIEYFGQPQYAEFGSHSFAIPAQPVKILQRVYGNYMEMPPVNTRKSKHFFNIDEEALDDCTDEKFLEAIKDIREYRDKNGYEDSKAMLEEEKPFTGIFFFIRYCYKKLIKKSKNFLRRIIRRHRLAKIGEFTKLPISEKTVFYDAFSGLGILDSPRAIFTRLLEREEFKDYTHIWTINDFSISKPNIKEFENLPNVKFVRRNTVEYNKYLCTAKYLICNSSFPQYFSRRPEQVYLNTWHGVPNKVMGYERPGERVNATQNIVHNFINTTHLIAANHFTAERMYKKAYMLDGIYEGKILDEPLPRTDTVKNTTKEQAMAKLNAAGLYTNKKIIIFAPTWKGKLYNSVEYDLTELKDAVKTLKSHIDTEEYEVFLRVHYFIYRAIMMDAEMKKLCVPFTIDTDELLSITDILISDYSSIFFDFLSTGKPILFYVPDLENYTENRGLYISMDEMPGPVSDTLEGVAKSINNLEAVKKEYADKYKAMYDWCSSKEDGKVSDRIINSVFLNKENPIVSCKDNKKEKLLIMADFTKIFPEEFELIEALKHIDYNKYDVTLLTGNPKLHSQASLLENIDRNVRILVNNRVINTKHYTIRKTYNLLKSGADISSTAARLDTKSEWRRLVGDAEFDKLCLFVPVNAAYNWLLLSFTSPIKDKDIVLGDLPQNSAFENEDYLKHFNTVFKNTEDWVNKL